MKLALANTIVALILFLLICAAIISLQVYLSKKESKYLGLILPVISLIFAFMNIAEIDAYDSFSNMSNYMEIFVAFLVANIPTIILVFIYLGIREKKNMKKELDKMNIKDL